MKKLSNRAGLIRLLKKFMLIMKLTLTLLLFGIISVTASTYSQNTRLDISLKDGNMIDLIKQIEEKSEFFFYYQKEDLKEVNEITVELNDATVMDILDMALKGSKFDYRIVDRYIVLRQSGDSFGEDLLASARRLTESQQRTVSGKVTDESGQPLPGVSVIIKGTTQGTVTNADGEYIITNVPADANLVFSFVGMRTQEVIIDNQTVINTQMIEETIGLEEIVAVGYGVQRKETLTGSVSSVEGYKFDVGHVTNISQSIAGQLPGLVSIAYSGEPGRDDATLRVRGINTLGNNSPLVVVDGVVGRSINRLNPSEIESISILKDASAAIYGARAANGVIIVTTKRGLDGKPEITANINQAWVMPTRIPEMCDSKTYATLINEIDNYNNLQPTFTDDDIQKYGDGTDPWRYPNTDWFSEVFKSHSKQYSGDISVRGGSQRIKFFSSIHYDTHDAIYKNSSEKFSKGNFRANVDVDVTDNVFLGIDFSGLQQEGNYPTYSTGNIFTSMITGGAGSGGRPTMVSFWPGNKPAAGFIGGMNPVVMATDAVGYNKENDYDIFSKVELRINIPWIKGLTLSGNASYDKSWEDSKRWETPYLLYAWDQVTVDENKEPVVTPAVSGQVTDNQLTERYGKGQQILLNSLINYDFNFGEKHNFKTLTGIERLTGRSSWIQAYRRYFPSKVIDQMFAGADQDKNNNGSAAQSARLNYFGRFNYDYSHKYMFEFVWRYDGSYIFPQEGRWGFFPGVSAGWTVSQENFWQSNPLSISYFKIRGSWGQTGNDRIAEYQYLATYGYESRPYVFNENVEKISLQELAIPNKEVTWEVANQSNIGFDSRLVSDKIGFSADYFYNLRTNILWYRDASVPYSTGLTLPRENIGEVINQGLEFELSYGNRAGNFSYDISINGSYAKNKIKFWDETPGAPDYQKSTGRPINAGLYYNAIGIFKDQAAVDAYPHWAGARPGDVIFEDVNEDGVIDGLDRVRFDKTDVPVFIGGMTTELRFKNLYAMLFFQGATGAVRTRTIESGRIGNFLLEDAEGRWTEENPDAKKPRTWNAANEYWSSSNNTYWLRNNDYIRLKNIQIGYNISSSVTNKLGISGLTIYLSGQNVLTVSHEKVFDPETVGNRYPLNKIYNTGIKLTF